MSLMLKSQKNQFEIDLNLKKLSGDSFSTHYDSFTSYITHYKLCLISRIYPTEGHISATLCASTHLFVPISIT